MQQGEFFNDFGKNSGFKRVEFVHEMPQLPQWYSFNTFVLEIANNFPFVQWLMYRHKEKMLGQKVGLIEQEWFNFIMQNKISILDYKKGESEKFISDHYMKLPEPELKKEK